jgi:general secretion pathway protein E
MAITAQQLFTSDTGQKWEGTPDPNWVNLLPYNFSRRFGVLVAGAGDDGAQVLCTKTPSVSLMTELRRKVGRPLSFFLIDEADFSSLARRAYDSSNAVVPNIEDEIDLDRLAYEMPDTTDLLESADDAPIIRLINALLSQAIREHASDIHIEAFEQRSVVRFRVDGVLKDIMEPQRELHSAIVSRLKIMAKLDIAEKRMPQDGRISLRLGGHPVDVRVSTLPTNHGERVVLRILDKQSARFDVAELGMEEQLRDRFDRMIQSPHGIVLVTGPTGSGKTTTLYAGLSKLDRTQLNIMTVEDPIEYDLDGIGQMQVNPKIELTFAQGLRSILRQDPDVVLVGEIRDFETAEIAVQASLTGHLVLSTLHTNTAVGAITRLIDMGVEPFLISSSLAGVLAQRLVRVLCPKCKQAVAPSATERDVLGLKTGDPVKIYLPIGCDDCGYNGYQGRTGIYELVNIDQTLRNLIHERASEEALLKHVRLNSPGLQQYGFNKVLSGITSLDEVLRVTRDE